MPPLLSRLAKMPRSIGSITGKILGSIFGGVQSLISSLFPPSFPSSALLSLWDGTNTPDGLGKVDVINAYNLTAVEGPCLTLETGDTIRMIGHGTLVSNMGDGTATYDGTDLTVTGDGSFFKLIGTKLVSIQVQ